jgi:flagellum-specific peptidoglycan hydrolase FlgJ
VRLFTQVEQKTEITYHDISEAEALLYPAMAEAGLQFQNVVFVQGILETGWFNPKNPVFQYNKNWLGLKCAQYRKTYCIGTKYGHAVFESYAHCLLDYVEWQKKYMPRYAEKYGPIQTEDDYIDFLQKWAYAEDKQYAKKLKKILKLIKNHNK